MRSAASNCAVLLALLSGPSQRSWMFGPFVKPAQPNPVISPNPTSRFRSPITDSVVAWEEYATFNPAAVVRDGRIIVLYRAEEASGQEQIGGPTSRPCLAQSSQRGELTRGSD